MLVGRYEIVGELGRGGMARVHLARQLDLDRYAALKELGSFHREDTEMAARFVRESRLAGALNHPSIVTVLDFFEHDGTPYIAMEYVARGSLRPWVGQLDVAQVGGVLESVLAGLAHAHGHGVVHRDLKPENLMVTDEGRVKITDFGIAKALVDNNTAAFRTATGVTIGTPAYMAPEQAMAQDIGPWTDLYSTGVIAYELLSGSVPFTSSEPVAVLLAHCQQAPVALAERAPSVPAPIAAWVDALLAKDPADRPQSARAAWEELEEHLLECVGARWRRSARLEGDPEEAAPGTPSGRPITPAQFPTDDDAWQTFGGTDRDVAPALDGDAPTEPSTPPAEAAGSVPNPHLVTDTPAPRDPPPSAPASQPSAPAAATPRETPVTAVSEPSRARRAAAGRRPRLLLVGGAVLAAAAVVVALAVTLAGGEEDPAPGTATNSTAGARDAGATPGTAAAPLGDEWLRAIHIVSYEGDGFSKPAFVDALRRAKADGATHVVLQPLLTTASSRSSKLDVKEDAPTDETLVRGIQAADREGLLPIIQPYVYVGPEGNYSGVYDPADPDAFFDAYQERIAAYADIAGEHGADAVVAGTMLSLLDGPEHTERWTAILTDTRERCGCRVTYAAENVEGADRIQFWNAADAIGVSVIEALTSEPSTDAEVLARAWAPTKRRLEALSTRWDKPVVFTDLGYQSREDQAAAAAYDASGEASESAQSALYEAAFRAFRDTPWFAGVAWQELNGDGVQPEADDFSFAGKQAEDVLRAWHTAE